MLPAEHLLDLAAFHEAGELFDALGKLGRDIFALRRPVDQYAEVIGLGGEGGDQLYFFLDAAAALESFLRLDLVVPEIGRRRAGLYLCKLVTRSSCFKDNSGDRRRALRGPGTDVSTHRERKPRIPPAKSSETSVNAAHTYANRSPILP